MATEIETTIKSYVTKVTPENISEKLQEYIKELEKRTLALECSNISIVTKVRMMNQREMQIYSEIEGM